MRSNGIDGDTLRNAIRRWSLSHALRHGLNKSPPCFLGFGSGESGKPADLPEDPEATAQNVHRKSGSNSGRTPPNKGCRMSEVFLKWLKELIASGNVHSFYVSAKWHKKRDEILRKDRYECQLCKNRGRYRRAVLVHHVKHVKNRPDLAISDYYTDDNGKSHRQLISVCRECHETVCHPERMKKDSASSRFTTEERWD